jgi:hypothetical protein
MSQNEMAVDHSEETGRSSETLAIRDHPRRQYVLDYCWNTANTTINVEELAIAIQVSEEKTRETSSADDQRRLIEIDLHHAHLPKLARGGVFEYDPVETVVHCASEGAEP